MDAFPQNLQAWRDAGGTLELRGLVLYGARWICAPTVPWLWINGCACSAR